jgi:hypothetical protein
MTNAFDSANYPTTEPTELVAGDMWRWKRSDLNTDYPNSAYTLKYALRLQGAGTTEIEITASASGLEYIIEVGSSTTAPISLVDILIKLISLAILTASESQSDLVRSNCWRTVTKQPPIR